MTNLNIKMNSVKFVNSQINFLKKEYINSKEDNEKYKQ